MTRVLVLGAGGMAGHIVSLFLREKGFDVDTVSAKNPLDQNTYLINAMDLPKFRTVLDQNKYGSVINCIGLLVKESDNNKESAVYLNAYLPHFLENHYKNSETRIIHLSTDGVFSSNNPPYSETSKYDAESFYGRSKALGEVINGKDLTFRMSIIGPDMNKEGPGLFNWFYAQKGEMSGYTNVLWNGITTLELAKGIAAAIEQNLIGLYHLVPGDTISKYSLLKLFKEEFDRKDLKIKAIEGVSLNATLTNTRTDFYHQIPGYKTMVRDMKIWIESHPKVYKHYEN